MSHAARFIFIRSALLLLHVHHQTILRREYSPLQKYQGPDQLEYHFPISNLFSFFSETQSMQWRPAYHYTLSQTLLTNGWIFYIYKYVMNCPSMRLITFRNLHELKYGLYPVCRARKILEKDISSFL